MNVDIEVDIRHALLRRLVRAACIPVSFARSGVPDIGELQASPLRQLAAAFARELPCQHDLLAGFVGANDMRTQFAGAAFIAANDLLFALDRGTKDSVGGGGHRRVPESRLICYL